MRRLSITCVLVASCLAAPELYHRASIGAEPAAAKSFRASEQLALAVTAPNGKPAVTYVTGLPADSKLSVKSAGFFHPLCTPSGRAVTDLAPDDHRHHRGVFLAWVEMHGAKDADFWGWGEHAPKEGRAIEHRSVKAVTADGKPAELQAHNEWVADGQTMIDEVLSATVDQREGCNVLDLTYRLTPAADTRLARWAFSGFCVRLPKKLPVVFSDPSGTVDRPPPDHTKPESDWPAADWYDATVVLADGQPAGVAVIDHPQNPPSLWHNEGRIAMLNPCIVAPGEVQLKKGVPLVLRYRVVTHDGPAPAAALKKLAAEFREAKSP